MEKNIIGIDFGNKSIKIAQGIGIEGRFTIDNDYPPISPTVAFEERRRIFDSTLKVTDTAIDSLQRYLVMTSESEADHASTKSNNWPGFDSQPHRGQRWRLRPKVYYREMWLTATQLVGMLFGHVRRTTLGQIPADTIIAVPHWYTDRDRQALADCLVIGGLNPTGIITDIVAVALDYGISHFNIEGGHSRVVAFLDVGHSTTSAAIVTFSENGLRVHAIATDSFLGGEVIDQSLMQHFAKTNPHIDPFHQKPTSLLTQSLEQLKKTLLKLQEAEIDLISTDKSPLHRMKLTRDQYQSLLSESGWLDRVSAILMEAINTSQIDPKSLHSVELVGGSGSVPSLKEHLQTQMKGAGCSTRVKVNSELSAARGVAHAGALRSFRGDAAVLRDHSTAPFDINWVASSRETAKKPSWIALSTAHRLNDLDLVNLLDQELYMEEMDKLAAETEEVHHELVRIIETISEKMDGVYAAIAHPESMTRLQKALDNAMRYLVSSERDEMTKLLYEAHLEVLHDIVDPLDRKSASLHSDIPVSGRTSHALQDDNGSSSNQRGVQLFDMGTYLLARFSQSGNVNDLDESIPCLREALSILPPNSPELQMYLVCLGSAYSLRFEKKDDYADNDEAIALYERASKCPPSPRATLASDSDRLVMMNNLGNALVRRFERSGDADDLEKAISAHEKTVQSASGHVCTEPDYLTNLGAALLRWFQIRGDQSDLNRGIFLCQTADEISPPGHPRKLQYLHNHGLSLQCRFERYNDLKDIDTAIKFCEEAVRGTPDTHPSKPRYFYSLGTSFMYRFGRSGDAYDIKQAVFNCEEAVRLAKESHPERPTYLAGLSTCLISHYEHDGQLSGIQRAVEVSELAVKMTTDLGPGGYVPLHALGISLLAIFLESASAQDINRAVVVLEKAARLTKNHADRPLYFMTLGRALAMRFEEYGDITDIDKAIRVQEKAEEQLPDDQATKPNCLSHLARSLSRRFSRLNEVLDIDKAIKAEKRALKLLPKDSPTRFKYTTNLGNSLLARFEIQRSIKDAKRSIELHQNAVEAIELMAENHPDAALVYNSLGLSLTVNFEASGNIQELDKAVDAYEKATACVVGHHKDSHAYHLNLGNALIHRFDSSRQIVDITKAITSLERAVNTTPEDHPYRDNALNTLARALIVRFKAFGSPSDVHEAIRRYSQAATSRSGSPWRKFLSARDWVTCARDVGNPTLKNAYECLLDLLPRVAWLGLDLDRRREEISKMGSVACDAAADAIAMGDPKTAVTWLEKGRFIIWSQGLRLRSPVDELRAAHPNLADSLEKISTALENKVNDRIRHVDTQVDEKLDGHARDLQFMATRQRALADEFDRLLANIRKKRGFEHFLLPKTFSELRKAADKYPVAILNPSKYRCDAVLLMPDDVRVIELPIGHQRLQKLSDEFGMLLKQSGRTMRGSERGMRVAPARKSDAWSGPLGILWDLVASHIIKALDLTPSSKPQRMWWCPTGIFSRLPLHAAGDYNVNKKSVPEVVVSSYTPTLGLLLREPNSEVSRRSPSVVAVGVSRTTIPGLVASPLPMVKDEMSAIGNIVPSKSLVMLQEGKATVNNIVKAISTCTALHLACHAQQDPMNPLSSAFLVHGEKLYLSRLIRESLPNGEFAFLSACQTAQGDENIPDEAMHLAGAMLFAGFRSVIATMWSIDDADGPIVTKAVYSALFKTPIFDGSVAANALHHVIGQLRANGAPFERWVPFISLGL
ncbi:Hsp70 protein-domain-containing protein [Crassisporium funariophilum]|nr:Hsp70 protein-domain-containing protein [Crassisporium funariophilum]